MGAVARLQGVQQRSDMELDGAFGNAQFLRDALVGLPLGHQLQHLALPRGGRGGEGCQGRQARNDGGDEDAADAVLH